METGKLSEEKEFYAPVRLRGGKRVADLASAGIRYIELRNIDIDPFARYGISKEQVAFLHFFLLFLSTKEEGSDADAWIEEGNQKNDQVALEHPLAPLTYQQEAQALITEMMDFAQALELPHPPFLDQLSEMLAEPERTFAGRLFSASQATS